MQNTQEKADLQKMKVNAMKINATKITKVCADGNKLCTGKEWRPSLGGRSIVVVSE